MSLKRFSKNTRIAYLNINSVAGFKFFELKSFIQEGLFDIVVVSETKIDDSFPDSHFYIKGFRMFRKDRNRFGGGLLIYTRRGFIIHRINDLEGNNVESIPLLVRSNNSSKGILIIGAYKPPNVPKNIWEPELNTLLLRSFQRYNHIVLLGDLNCDLSHRTRVPRKEGPYWMLWMGTTCQI